MKLHENKELFAELLTAASQPEEQGGLGIRQAFLEKDYWVTRSLQMLAESRFAEQAVFKGGTSLSKASGVGFRFSEDIDIAIVSDDARTDNQTKALVGGIGKVMSVGLTEVEMPDTRKFSKYRKVYYRYPELTGDAGVTAVKAGIIQLEVVSFANPYPYEKKRIGSLVRDFLLKVGREDMVEEYGLGVFELNVLDVRRTATEKLVSLMRQSLGDDYMGGLRSKIRHFYDLHYLWGDETCRNYLMSEDFKQDFGKLLAEDQARFKEPEGWQQKRIGDSPLLADFNGLWQDLQKVYEDELPGLAYRPVPDAALVAESMRQVLDVVRGGRENQAAIDMDLQLQPFPAINLADPFFDSLKEAYPEFCEWYNRKAAAGEKAFVFHFDDGRVADFLYMKIETEAVTDVVPVLPAKKRLKVGIFKLLSRGTRRGERFMKKIMDKAMAEDVDEVYVTIFPKPDLEYLIHLFGRFGFNHQADKPHPSTGSGQVASSEWVMVKDMRAVEGNVLEDYPRMRTAGRRKWLLGIYPKWHTPLFPDSILKNESYDMVQDCTPTNGIYKIYISWNPECAQMMPGDLVVIYRSSDEPGRAWYRSVVSTICTVYETKKWWDFKDVDEFLDYTKYSVFEENDRRTWFRTKRNLVVIKMLYNVAFSKRAIRKDLVENGALDAQARPSLLELTDGQFKKIIELGQANERYIID